MKKLLVFLSLICHMNFSMFIPQVDEVDVYNSMGQPVDDINSFYEYLDQVAFGNHDDTPEDEDDDSGTLALTAKVDTYCFDCFTRVLNQPKFSCTTKTFVFHSDAKILPSVFFEIPFPPPEC